MKFKKKKILSQAYSFRYLGSYKYFRYSGDNSLEQEISCCI